MRNYADNLSWQSFNNRNINNWVVSSLVIELLLVRVIQNQSCIEFKKFTRSSNELTFNSSSKFPSLSFMNERKERNFELELKVSSIELLLNFLNFIQLWLFHMVVSVFLSMAAFSTTFLLVKILQQPIRIFEINGYWSCHGEENACYHVKEQGGGRG